MDLKGLEKYLALNHIDFKPLDKESVLINLGFLVGRVQVKYVPETQQFDFNDKPRWVIQVLLMAMMLYFLATNFHVYSPLQLNMCVGVTVVMLGIFGYKETRIKWLKQEIQKEKQATQ